MQVVALTVSSGVKDRLEQEFDEAFPEQNTKLGSRVLGLTFPPIYGIDIYMNPLFAEKQVWVHCTDRTLISQWEGLEDGIRAAKFMHLAVVKKPIREMLAKNFPWDHFVDD